ncbi:piggyBac transposable element-derived protein 4-like [Ixodes scapularis]|uniref:piggyBac transposable element-derived protein 4-like n=1 Tax=Ixodes scapularis TaxID=6945 RepID=UPI001A9F2DD0|nr:piggyBac transposable element-derived protein 4-like [Ixodes scapularis]
MVKAFASAHSAHENLSVDESLMKFRGHLAYVQFNLSKRARFGIEFYKLCESSSGYCLNFSIYMGKDTKSDATASMLCSEAIVIDLLGDRLGDRHAINLDNWYSSPHLFLAIKNGGSNAVGTVRTNRKNMLKDLKARKLAKGGCKTSFSHDIMAIQSQDRKPVSTMLSTSHSGADIIGTGKRRHRGNEPVLKPLVVQEYNRGMGGVDRQDQQLASFPIVRRYAKGYKTIFYVLDMAVYNAYVIHAKKTGKRRSYTDWKVDLSDEIIVETALPRYQR